MTQNVEKGNGFEKNPKMNSTWNFGRRWPPKEGCSRTFINFEPSTVSGKVHTSGRIVEWIINSVSDQKKPTLLSWKLSSGLLSSMACPLS